MVETSINLFLRCKWPSIKDVNPYISTEIWKMSLMWNRFRDNAGNPTRYLNKQSFEDGNIFSFKVETSHLVKILTFRSRTRIPWNWLSVISSEPLCKDANAWLTMVSLKPLSDQQLELGTFELWISGLMLDLLFFIISRAENFRMWYP